MATLLAMKASVQVLASILQGGKASVQVLASIL
jgi:hypothetical protein